MTLLVREYTYNNFLRKLASERILIEMSGRVAQIKVNAAYLTKYGSYCGKVKRPALA
eukprot:COSAG01_NODE_44397_length_418_cov_3.456250_2_plen_57_part_00